MHTPLAEIGRAASEYRKGGRPEHGALVLGFYRNDKGQGVDIGIYNSERNGWLLIQKAKNTTAVELAEIAMPWGFYQQWAYVWFPPPETL